MLGLATAFGVGGASTVDDGLYVVARDDAGAEVARAPLPTSGPLRDRFSIAYQHSYYDSPATETFLAADGGFSLVSVGSPSEAVLDYYGLAGERRRDETGHLLLVRDAPVVRELPLLASDVGRRTLVAGEQRTPLYDPGRPPRHLRLEVRRAG